MSAKSMKCAQTPALAACGEYRSRIRSTISTKSRPDLRRKICSTAILIQPANSATGAVVGSVALADCDGLSGHYRIREESPTIRELVAINASKRVYEDLCYCPFANPRSAQWRATELWVGEARAQLCRAAPFASLA